MTVYGLLEQAAATWPDRVALVDDRGALTFRELYAEAESLRESLRAEGLGPRQGLGVLARNGRGFVVAVFAGLGCGAVVMPMFHQLRRSELADQLTQVALHAVLDDRALEDLLPAPGVPLLRGELRFTRMNTPPERPFVPHVEDAAFVRYTSGTTGKAKGVVVSHRAVLERTAAAREALDLGPDDTVAWVLPMAYHFIVSVVMYVRYGVTIAVCPDMFADGILDVARERGATLLYASPLHVRMLTGEPSGRTVPTLRCVVSTSSALPRDLALAFQARYGLPVRQVYGIIECGLPLGDLGAEDAAPGTVGRALPGYEIGVLDDEGRPLPAGVAGNLAIRGPGMFDGYLDPPSGVADVLRLGWFMTGDLAVVSEDGRVTISGRRKSMINVAGHKVFPEEVEAVLDAWPGVAASRAYGVPHPTLGEVVHAEVVPDPDGAVDVEALRRACQARLSGHKIPQQIVVVASVRMTGSGKVAR
ncbi:MAG TPA: class I adenylate-forming enzyme family protein [Myxococcota bacterium]|nr:class I adenylate-forming enzyme family protein [Myxococcota bacterium]